MAARPSFDRTFVDETVILQRELKGDVPGWLWAAASLIVLVISIALVLALGWGTSRLARGDAASPAIREGGSPRSLARASA